MKLIKKNIILIMTLLVLGVSGCDNDKQEIKKELDVELIIEELTLEEYGGRLQNTNGNRLAQQYLANTLEAMDIDTYNNSYFQKYENTSLQVSKAKLELINPSGEKIAFKYNEDFTFRHITNIDFSRLVSNGIVEEDGSIKIKFLNEENNEEFDLMIIESKLDGPFEPVNKSHITEMYPKLLVKPNVYQYMLENPSAMIVVEFESKLVKYESANIVGVIKGANATEAILITAHFDHVGSIPGISYFAGAYDNASGVAGALNIINNLKQYYLDRKPTRDIIICLTNDEEIDFLGGKTIGAELSSKYDFVYGINIDSIGYQSHKKIGINYSKGNNFETSFFKYFNNLEYEVSSKILGASDHIVLDEFSNINSVLITTVTHPEVFGNIIHNVGDISKNLDIDYITKISDDIFEFILSIDLLDISTKVFKGDINKIMQSEYSKLEPYQYKYLIVNNEETIIYKNYFVYKLSELPITLPIDELSTGEFTLVPYIAIKTVYDESELENCGYNQVCQDYFDLSKVSDITVNFYDESTLLITYSHSQISLEGELNVQTMAYYYEQMIQLGECSRCLHIYPSKLLNNEFISDIEVFYFGDNEEVSSIIFKKQNGTDSYYVYLHYYSIDDSNNNYISELGTIESAKKFILDTGIFNSFIEYSE